MAWSPYNNIFSSADATAFKMNQDWQAKQALGFVPNSNAGLSFAQASQPIQYAGAQALIKPPSASFAKAWTANTIDMIPKTIAGSSKNADKFAWAMKQIGVPSDEWDNFKRFLGHSDNTAVGKFQDQMDKANTFGKFTWQNNQSTPPLATNTPRSNWEKLTDMLMGTTYASSNFTDSLVNKQGFGKALGNAKNGFEAGMNPFSDNGTQYRFDYNKVLEDAGMKVDPNADKFTQWNQRLTRGSVGLLADIFLDPSTYVTGGLSDFLKGSGIAGKAIGKLTPYLQRVADMHGVDASGIKNVKQLVQKVQDTHMQDALSKGATSEVALAHGQNVAQSAKDMMNFRKGKMNIASAENIVRTLDAGKQLSEDQITKQAGDLLETFGKLRGVGREVNPVKVGLQGTLPGFGLKAVGSGLFGNSVFGKALQKLGDSSVVIPGAGKALNIAGKATGAQALYGQLRHAVYGTQMARLFSNNARIYKWAINNPDTLTKFVQWEQHINGTSMDKVLKDRAVHDYAEKYLNVDHSTSSQIIKALEDKSKRTIIQRSLGALKMAQAQPTIDELRNKGADAQVTLNDIENQKQHLDYLRESANQGIDGANEALQQAELEYRNNLLQLKDYHSQNQAENQRVLQLLRDEKNHYTQSVDGLSSPMRPTEPTMEEPTKPTLPSVRNPKMDVLDHPEEPNYPAEPKLGDFYPEGTTQLQYEGSGILEDWEKKFKEANDSGKKIGIDDRMNVARQLSQLIYHDATSIHEGTPQFALENIIDLIKKGESPERIKQYIDARKVNYDGRFSKIYNHTAQEMGYKDWSKDYTEKMNVLRQKEKEGSLTKYDIADMRKLESMALEREMRLSKLKDMSPKQLDAYLKKHADDKMNADADEALKREYKGQKKGYATPDDEMRQQILDDQSARTMQEYDGNKAPRYGENGDPQIGHEDVTKIKSQILQDIAFKNTKAGEELNMRGLNPHHHAYASDVAQEAIHTMKNYFPYNKFSDLSPDAQKFVIGMSKTNVFNRSMGRPIIEKSWADKEKIKDNFEASLGFRHMANVTEAVKATTKEGDRALFRDAKGIRIHGKVLGQETRYVDEDRMSTSNDTSLKNGQKGSRTDRPSNETYTVFHIQDAKGNVHEVKPGDILEVNKKKPLEQIMHNTMESRIHAEYSKSLKDHADTLEKLRSDWEAQKAHVDEQNVQALQDHMDAMKEAQNKRELARAQYQEDLNTYHEKVNENDRIRAMYESSLSDWHDAIRQTSQIADDWMNHVDDIVKDIQDRIHAQHVKIQGEAGQLTFHENTLSQEFQDYRDKTIQSIKEYEITLAELEHASFDGKTFTLDTSAHEARVAELEAIHADLWEKHLNNPDHVKTQADLAQTEKELEDAHNTLFEAQNKSYTVEDLQHIVKTVQDALGSEEGFVSYMNTLDPEALRTWDKKNGNSAFVGKYVFEAHGDMGQHAQDATRFLIDEFKKAGEEEWNAKKVNGLLNAYFPHELSDEVRPILENNAIHFSEDGTARLNPRDAKKGQPWLTNDFGYGQVWNPYGETRQIRQVTMPSGEVVKDPNVFQINDAVRHVLGGKDLFKTNVKEVYLSRMLKHNELMYDHQYTNNMMNEIGHDLNEDMMADKGNHIVMNYGKFQETLSDMAKMQNSLHLSEVMHGEAQRLSAENKAMGYTMPKEEFDAHMKRFYHTNFPQDVLQNQYQDWMEKVFHLLGMSAVTYTRTATPMLKLESEQAKALTEFHSQVVRDFEENLNKMHDRLDPVNPDPDTVDRLMKNREFLTNIKPPQIKQVDKEFVDRANGARMVSVARDQKRWLAIYDKVQHWFKLMQTTINPSFHARNFASNMYLNYMAVGNDAFDMDAVVKSIQAYKNINDTKFLRSLPAVSFKDGSLHHWDELVDLAHGNGAIDKNFFAKDLGANDAGAGLFNGNKIDGRKFDPTNTKNFIGFTKGTEVGNHIENGARLMQFISHMRNGMDAKSAGEQVNKFLFDYSNITPFERNVMKRIFPFYTWLRKNMKLQLTHWMDNPRSYVRTREVQETNNSMVDPKDRMDNQYVAPFAKDWIQTPFSITEKQTTGTGKNAKTMNVKKPVLWNPNMPYQDFWRFPDPTHITDTVKNLIGMLNTPMKSAIELGTNKNEYFDSPIVAQGADTPTAMGAVANYLGNNVTPYSTAEGVATKTGANAFFNLVNFASGIKMLAYNYDQSKKMGQLQASGKVANPNNQPIDKLFGWMQNKEDDIHNILPNFVKNTQAQIADITMKYMMGEDMDASTAGKLYPFVWAMQKGGMMRDTNTDRQWLTTVLDNHPNIAKAVMNETFSNARVTANADGDSFFVKLPDGTKTEIRVNLIDTPESVKANTPVEPYGLDASHFADKVLPVGKGVQLVISPDKDHYGRTVAYVLYKSQDDGDMHDLGLEQLKQGFAKNQYWNLTDNTTREPDYKQAQDEASKKGVGVWSMPGYAKNDQSSFWNMDDGSTNGKWTPAQLADSKNGGAWQNYLHNSDSTIGRSLGTIDDNTDARETQISNDQQAQLRDMLKAIADANKVKLPSKPRTTTAKKKPTLTKAQKAHNASVRSTAKKIVTIKGG